VSVAAHSMIENGRLEGLTVRTIRRALMPLDIPLDWDGGWRRPELARLRDADHSVLADAWARWLQLNGWLVRPEVSFNRYGDRGRIDLLAYHPIARALLVIEVKTAIVDVQELLGTLHIKARVARFVAGELGWHPLPSSLPRRRRRVDRAASGSRARRPLRAIFSARPRRDEMVPATRRPARGDPHLQKVARLH
jgi:hypothetical protein